MTLNYLQKPKNVQFAWMNSLKTLIQIEAEIKQKKKKKAMMKAKKKTNKRNKKTQRKKKR